MLSARFHRGTSVLTAALLVLLAGGCTVNSTGAVVGRVIPGQGAVVVQVYSVGGYLSSREPAAGLTLGLRKRTEIFDQPGAASLEPGWHWFHVPSPPGLPLAAQEYSSGVSVHAGQMETGLSVGVRSTWIFTGMASRDATADYFLQYRAADPAGTRIIQCKGGVQCRFP